MFANTPPPKAIKIFYCYAPKDRGLRNELAKHLRLLEWQGLIIETHNFDISPGLEREKEVAERLDNADIILLLISPDFMDSYDCYEVELRRAIARHKAGTARVIPILLRPVDWRNAPFSGLQPLPASLKPVTTSNNRDKAFSEVGMGITSVVNQFLRSSQKSQSIPPMSKPSTGINQGSFATQSGDAAPQTKQSSQSYQRQSLSSNGFSLDDIDDLFSTFSSPNVTEQNDGWLHLRWFILASALVTGILFVISLIFPASINMKLSLIPWAICLILGLIETNHFAQWYWFVGFVVCSPLIGLLYAVGEHYEKPLWPINLKQLIMMLSFLGYALCVLSFIIYASQTANDLFFYVILYVGGTFIVSAVLIRLIHHIRENELDAELIVFVVMPFAIPFAPLMNLSKVDDQLKNLDNQ